MRTGAKVTATAAAVVAVGLAWSLLSAVWEHERPLEPAALIRQTALTGFKRVAVVEQNLQADRISYAIFTGPRTTTGPEVRIADRDDAFTEGATVPEEWRGVLEGISNARLNGDCWADVLRFPPDRLPDERLESWGVEEGEVADARAGRLDIAYVRIVCGRERH